MTYQETLKLIDAGFTKDEILAMSTAPASGPAPAPEKQEAPPEVQKPAPAAEAKAEAQTPPAAQQDQASDAQRILAALGKLAEGVAVPPENTISFEKRLANSILAGMGIKSKED